MPAQGYNKKKGWWFAGNGSFISNGYVIYSNGLDGWDPNPIALKYGNKFTLDYTDKSSAPYAEFINLLSTAAARAKTNEKVYLTLKLKQLRDQDTAGFDVLWFNKIEEAIEKEDYSAAYTLLMRRDRDLEKFARELSAPNSTIAHSTAFYESQFSNFLKQKLKEMGNFQQGDDFFSVGFGRNTDFKTMVTEYFTNILKVDLDNNISAQLLRDRFISDLETIADASGGQIGMAFGLNNGQVKTLRGSAVVSKLDKKTGKEVKKYIKPGAIKDSLQKTLLTEQGQFRTPNALIEAVADGLARQVGRGLSQEAYVIGTGDRLGGHMISTGMMTYDKMDAFGNKIGNVQQKGDIVSFEVFGAELDVTQLIENVFGSAAENYSRDNLHELSEQLKNYAARNSASNIFEVQFNVKGYTSYMDLKIEGKGSFKNRLAVLQAEGIKDIGEKLIFMLNNTANGAIFNGQEGLVEDYIAAVCAAWMWDRPEELFNLDLNTPYNYRVIKLFNSGSAYYTASQIIQQVIDRLQGMSDNHFVKAIITPPQTYGDYKNLMDDIPVAGHPHDEWQSILQKRWEQVKLDAMTTGTLSIEFNQTELDQLLSNLRSILSK